MHFNPKNYSVATLIDLYTLLLKSRMVEEKMLVLLRQGKISKWFSGIGQEAISVGVISALEKDDWVFPAHRNLPVFLGRKLDLTRLISQWQGKTNGYSKGRERSFHFGSSEHHICGMISHMAAMLPVAVGTALAYTLHQKKGISVVFCGEGATSQGDFHEAINLAAVWKLPVIFVVENNGYALSTPTSEQYACESIIDKAPGYGIDALQIDGNNILEIYYTINQIAQSMREHRKPLLIEALTFRMRGHEEASGTKYVPEILLEKWSKKDPLLHFENFLLQESYLTEPTIQGIKAQLHAELEEAIEKADADTWPDSVQAIEEASVFAPATPEDTWPSLEEALSEDTSEKRMVDAIADAIRQAMEADEHLIILGQDIGAYGGVFKVTEGLIDTFGPERVRNTPLCESAVIGASLGLALENIPSIVELQFADFISSGFNQVVNNLATTYYRWGLSVPVVLRLPTGAGVSAGPFHSQATEAWFYRVPGLKIVYPSCAQDAKGLLLSAIKDPNPVLFYEHKALYRSHKQPIPDGVYVIPIGKATTKHTGNRLTLVTYGSIVQNVLELIETQSYDIELIDLRTVKPIDFETIYTSVKKTGKLLLVSEDHMMGSIISDIAAHAAQHWFEILDAPIGRVAAWDTPVPFSSKLEDNYLPNKRIQNAIEEWINF